VVRQQSIRLLRQFSPFILTDINSQPNGDSRDLLFRVIGGLGVGVGAFILGVWFKYFLLGYEYIITLGLYSANGLTSQIIMKKISSYDIINYYERNRSKKS